MRKLRQQIKGNLKTLWIIFLLLYSVIMLIFQISANSIPATFNIPFYIFIPGYAFAEALLSHLHRLEKITISLAFSLAILVGFKGPIRAFKMVGLVSEKTIVTILAMICLTTVLIKHFRERQLREHPLPNHY